jgi:hypothetical protein
MPLPASAIWGTAVPEAGDSPQGPPIPSNPAGSPVPEPTTLLLVGTGIVGIALTARVRRRRE